MIKSLSPYYQLYQKKYHSCCALVTIQNKVVIFSGIALYYGDTYILHMPVLFRALLERGERNQRALTQRVFCQSTLNNTYFESPKSDTKCDLRIPKSFEKEGRGGHAFRFPLYDQQLHSQPGALLNFSPYKSNFPPPLAKLQAYLRRMCTLVWFEK